MYVRIKQRRLKEFDQQGFQVSFRLYVVENHRIQGKPRQRIVRYLGSIRSSDLNNPAYRQRFLKRVYTRIDSIDEHVKTLVAIKVNLIKALRNFTTPPVRGTT
jgi:hypothetical protein